jgi:hypothetical protein
VVVSRDQNIAKALEVELIKRIQIEKAVRLDRIGFLKFVLPLIVEITAPGRKAFSDKKAHSGSPPE